LKTNPALYAVVLAGGGGTRLWPVSRRRKPKQLLPLCGDETMLARTCARVRPLIPADRQFVITVASHAPEARAQVCAIPEENVVVEPSGHGTAPCIGLMALIIHHRDPDGIMVSLHADHAIQDEEALLSVLQTAAHAAEDGRLVTLGIVPSCPETGYGYIQRGELVDRVLGHDVYRVERFTEKPDLETARTFVADGGYYWNSGMFVWTVAAILEETRNLLPDLYERLMEIRPALGSERQSEVIERVWGAVPNVSIDVGIMERADNVVMVPADIGWDDVGSWNSVADLLARDENGNVMEGEHVALDCQDTFIRSSGRLVAGVGLRGMIVIDTGDAVLVCPKDRAQDVKRIVEQLEREGKKQYL